MFPIFHYILFHQIVIRPVFNIIRHSVYWFFILGRLPISYTLCQLFIQQFGAAVSHEPTGIVVQCQTQRSQIQNRERCLQLLRAKLYEYEKAKQDAMINDLAGDYQAIEWGSQIRSYVFQPYTLVKDHRTGCESGNIQAVMDGDLMNFIETYLRSQQKKV